MSTGAGGGILGKAPFSIESPRTATPSSLLAPPA